MSLLTEFVKNVTNLCYNILLLIIKKNITKYETDYENDEIL